MPATPETILAFDFGLRRIGIAVGQQVTDSANPLAVARNGADGPDWSYIEALISEWHPARLIVGMPLHPDGTENEMTAAARQFIVDLARFDINVEAVDERYSSAEAQELLKAQRTSGLRGRIDRETIDSAAAALIAERWLKNTHQ